MHPISVPLRAGLPGVRHVEANPITGSVLLLIEPGQGIELESVLGGLFSLRSDRARQGTLRQKAALSLRDFDRKVKGFTGEELDLLSLAFAGHPSEMIAKQVVEETRERK
jgi:hypothetical protein